MEKKLIFSVTAKDCDWEFTKGSGNGGQKRNKCSTAVRVTHKDSGAVGYAQDARTQLENRKAAFIRMAETPKFKLWLKRQTSQAVLTEQEIEAKVDKLMQAQYLQIETY